MNSMDKNSMYGIMLLSVSLSFRKHIGIKKGTVNIRAISWMMSYCPCLYHMRARLKKKGKHQSMNTSVSM